MDMILSANQIFLVFFSFLVEADILPVFWATKPPSGWIEFPVLEIFTFL